MTDLTEQQPGQQFGSYTLIRLLGKGGFAEVYLGEHIYLKSLAAIKVLLTSLGTEERNYFRTEARTLATLNHPHIVRILDFGFEGDVPFLVMEYAPNGTLQQRHPRGVPLAPATIVPYVKQVASALQYAHDQKLIHRDIKSGNILLQDNNELLLSDFGVATLAQSTRQQSKQEFVGTATYMAPEQIRGKACQASDQYALGVVVYEWLSGGSLFQGSFTEVCAQHMFAPPDPLCTRIPTLSPQVEQVVMTALAKEPAQRFANVAAFAIALEQAYRSDDTVPLVQEVFSDTTPTFVFGQHTTLPDRYPARQEGTSQPEDPTDPPETSDSQPSMQEATTQPDPAEMVKYLEAQPSQVSSFWTARQTLRNMRQLSPRGVLTLVVLLVVVLSGLLYYAYAKTDRPASAPNQATDTRQPSAGITQQAATATGVLSATPTSRSSIVDVATSTPVPQVVPTATQEATSIPAPEPTPTVTSAPAAKPTPTPKSVCPPQIQSGSKGTWVKTLQTDLNSHGMKDSAGKPLVVDGDFGPMTQYAVKSWQQHAKLGADGIVGPETWHSLGHC